MRTPFTNRWVSLLGAAVALALALGGGTAYAATTGNIAGIVVDKDTGKPLGGVTITVQGPALQGEQTEFSDSSGRYIITELPPGEYVVRFYFSNKVVERPGVILHADQTLEVNGAIPTREAKTETYRIVEKAPSVDVGNTQIQTQVTSEFVRNMPIPGRNFDAVLTLAPGSASDDVGVSYGGATGLENNFQLDGLNTTDVAFGNQGSNMTVEFIKETELVTGGYNAEYGRSTGGVVNVITKSGSNEFHGDAWFVYTPFQLDPQTVARLGEAIAIQSKRNYAFDFGFDLGGPIIKDRLWFYVGFTPQYNEDVTTRRLRTRTASMWDHMSNYSGDLVSTPCPDYLADKSLCPAASFNTQYLPSSYDKQFYSDSSSYQYIAKLNLNINENNYMSLEYIGNINGFSSGGSPTATASSSVFSQATPIQDVVFHDINKLLDKRLQIDVLAGFHYSSTTSTPNPNGGNGAEVLDQNTRSLANYEPNITPCAIQQGMNGSSFNPCPVTNYVYGGFGFWPTITQERATATASATYFARLAGTHALKVGGDFEWNQYEDDRRYTGGGFFSILPGNVIVQQGFASKNVDPKTGMTTVSPLDGMMGRQNGLGVTTITQNESFYARDSWSVGFVPGLNINAGLRWELQQVQGQNGQTIISINDNIAPRVGFVYDFTRKGYSKIYASYGRFYESIPLDMNDRSFSGEGDFERGENGPGAWGCSNTMGQPFAGKGGKGGFLDPSTCKVPALTPGGVFGGTYASISPILQGQYLNEVVAGLQYDVGYDIVLGAAYDHRDLGRIIEDFSPDTQNYFIGNPGQPVDQGTVSDLQSQISTLDKQISSTTDATAKAALEQQRTTKIQTLAGYEAGAKLDTPKRDYNALILTANKRLSRNFMILASYTYSRTLGNYPGLYQASNGQTDPNISTQYDLRELMLNRYGPLPEDRPHNLKLNGVYMVSLGSQGSLQVGGSFNWVSGIPIEVLGNHWYDQAPETFILPRGSGGRTPDITTLDMHVAYQREFTKHITALFTIDAFNVLNEQGVTSVDETYTYDIVLPVANGTYSDLAHLKNVNGTAVHVNPNYGNATSYQAPFSMRFGLHLTF